MGSRWLLVLVLVLVLVGSCFSRSSPPSALPYVAGVVVAVVDSGGGGGGSGGSSVVNASAVSRREAAHIRPFQQTYSKVPEVLGSAKLGLHTGQQGTNRLHLGRQMNGSVGNRQHGSGFRMRDEMVLGCFQAILKTVLATQLQRELQ